MKKQHFPRYLLTLTVMLLLLSMVCFSVGAEESTVLSISGVPAEAAVGDTAANGTATVPEGAKYSVSWSWYKYTTADNMGEYEPFEGVLEAGCCYFMELTVQVQQDWAGWSEADESGNVLILININDEEDFAIASIAPAEDAAFAGQGVCFYRDFDFTEKLSNVAITGIPEVAAGNTAAVDTVVTDANADYTVKEVRWSYYDTETGFYQDFNGGTFENGGVYQLYICVQANAGLGFSDETVLTVNGAESDAFNTSSNSMFIYLDYDLSKKITEVRITGVTKPVAGETATTDGIAVPEDAPYSVSGIWYTVDPETGEPVEFTGAFEHQGYYFLELDLIAQEGYTFDVELVAYVDGEEQYPIAENNMAMIALSFDLLDVITDVELTSTDHVQIGQTASAEGLTVPEDAPYTATAYWIESTMDDTGLEPFEGVFKKGHIYHYCIELTPAAGSKFAEDAVVSYNGQVLDTATSGIVSAEGIIIIAQTYTGDLQPIDSIALYAPIAPGLTPEDVTVSAPEDAAYSFTEISWMDVDTFEEAAVFEEGKEYMLTACILPAEGYYIPETETLACLVNDQADIGFASGAYAYGYVFATLLCEEPVEETTEKVTEATTEAPTEAPTQITTEVPKDSPTAAPTEEATQAPTQQEVTQDSAGDSTGSGSDSSGTAGNPPAVTPPTGDNTMVLVLIALAVISAAAVILLLIKKKSGK